MIRSGLFLCILLGCMLFTGCTKNEPSDIDGQTVKTWLQVDILRSAIGSRTIGTPTTPGTQEENAISDITIYLTNSNEIVKVDNISILNRAESYVSALVPISIDMLDQEYQVFVVANPAKADLTLRGTTDFKELYATGADTYKSLTLGQMVMSNQAEQNPAPTVIITQENTKDNPARVNILLDRLSVKIEPRVSTDFRTNFADKPQEDTFFEAYTFTVEAAGLLNGATEFNMGQQWGNGGNGEAIQLLSPTWYYKPEEQYFTRYYNTVSDYMNTDTPPFVAMTGNTEAGYYLIGSPFYCLENNSPFYDYTGSSITPENQIKTKYKGLATGVVFRIRATRDNEPANFYRYNGTYYSDTTSDRTALAEAASLDPADFGNIAALRDKEIKVYENGNIYYTYWIKDKNPAYSGEAYDLSYAVIRNSYYLLQVNGLTRIGEDIPGGGYEPEEPIDKIEQLEVVAVCQDWTLVDVTHEFN